MAGASNGINFTFLAETLGKILSTSEAELNSKISSMGSAPTQAQMFEMQVGLQKWTMLIQMQSTMNKELGDALKGIIQKSS